MQLEVVITVCASSNGRENHNREGYLNDVVAYGLDFLN